MSLKGIPIANIVKDSIAEELGIELGDLLIHIQGQLPKDYIEYVYLTSDEELEILIQKSDGEEWLLEVERDPDEELGIQLEGIIYDQLKECNNHCMFCFVDQMPTGLRHTLSFRDDDYRFSFLQGSFMTLTNLSEKELERIKKLKLSPLYISVHTTNPTLRQKMMANKKAGKIMDVLTELKEAGISFHTQIVLCPDINDGDELKRSIEDLASLRPNLLSLAIVPVGLTKFRDKLYPLTNFTSQKAEEVYQIVRKYQDSFNKEGENFVYLSDEFYLLTGHNFPSDTEYHEYPQLENGIGLSRLLLDEFYSLEEKLPQKMFTSTRVLFVTSILGEKVLIKPVQRLREIKDLQIDLLAVKNKFFGEKVTVTGLLTGRDLKEAIQNIECEQYNLIILSKVVLNDEELFIDGMSCQEFKDIFPKLIFVDGFDQIIDKFREMNLLEVKAR
ncbi:MAG: DUF512 domain-containing protein [Halanaerobiales bacterium]|nr:DUF512 domain-containing protein [Halanaerobiales bacterium]